MKQITITGMVLTSIPIGDYDRRLVILTKERGKISAFARGARKQNSPLLACCQPFSFGEFFLFEGRDSYSISGANISHYFVELREELERVYFAFYFCELASYFTRENTDESPVLKLLFQSLKALSKKTIVPELIRYIYELRLIGINGEAPQVFECVSCGVQKDVYQFSVEKRGLVCVNCAGKGSFLIALSGSAIYTMQFILVTPIEKLYTFTVSKDVLEELAFCMMKYRKAVIHAEFKSLELIELL